jgi:flagellar assembly factor FliW
MTSVHIANGERPMLPPELEAGHRSPPAGNIAFPQGLPGFPGAKRFVLAPLTGAGCLLLLRSADDPSPRFVVLPFVEDTLPLAFADLTAAGLMLGIRERDLAVLLVVSASPTTSPPCLWVNLRAPILLDSERRIGAQLVLSRSGYPIRHRLPVIGGS